LPPQPEPLPFGVTRVDDGQWHHIAVLFKEDRIYCYVDGRIDGSVGQQVHAATTSPLLMGPEASEEGADNVADRLQDVQVYSFPLSDEQILGLATECKDLNSGITLPFSPWQVRDFWKLQAEQHALGAEKQAGAAAARQLASECLALGGDPTRAFQDEVICDFFVNLLDFAQSICLTARKTAVFAAIMQTIFVAMFRRSKTSLCVGEPFSASECFLEYKRLLLDHAATSAGTLATVPPRRLQIFSTADVKKLTEFVSGTLFQHFFLYQCVIVSPQDMKTSYASVILEQPRGPPQLNKGKVMPKKQDAAASTAQQKPKSEDVFCSEAGETEKRAGEGAAPVQSALGEDTPADATQVPGRLNKENMRDDELLDFMVAEGSKAVHDHIEAQIQARDEALQKSA